MVGNINMVNTYISNKILEARLVVPTYAKPINGVIRKGDFRLT